MQTWSIRNIASLTIIKLKGHSSTWLHLKEEWTIPVFALSLRVRLISFMSLDLQELKVGVMFRHKCLTFWLLRKILKTRMICQWSKIPRKRQYNSKKRRKNFLEKKSCTYSLNSKHLTFIMLRWTNNWVEASFQVSLDLEFFPSKGQRLTECSRLRSIWVKCSFKRLQICITLIKSSLRIINNSKALLILTSRAILTIFSTGKLSPRKAYQPL